MTYFDLRRHTRSISTCSPEAQRWFDLRRSGLGATRAIPFVKAECPQRVVEVVWKRLFSHDLRRLLKMLDGPHGRFPSCLDRGQ